MRVLYVDIDTLRPDHLGCYGYHRATSPNIDAIASRGIRFDNVYASDVPCLPSRTALVTGTFGIRNGVANHSGAAADLASRGTERDFFNQWVTSSLPAVLGRAGMHTASISSFPMRHGATWWSGGFLESMNLMRGIGFERADEVLPGALDWLDRRGEAEDWFLHVHLWDPHTPHNAPEELGNPFADDPVPAWHTEEVRARNWDLPGPHSAQEPWGFTPDEWGAPGPRSPWNLASMADVTLLFDGYDVGVHYADEAVGALCDKLVELGVLDDTAIWISSDHGEAFGELGVYADHQAADEATAHVPAVLAWPGLPGGVQAGLHYHLDVAATVCDLAGATLPDSWDGRSLRDHLEAGTPAPGRDHLVLTQGAWTCQRGVRVGDHLYLRTHHDGFHAHWPEEMLFDVVADPHEQIDLLDLEPEVTARVRALLDEWVAVQLERSYAREDPIATVLAEGGPCHVRGHLPEYLERLAATGRERWIRVLEARHGRRPSSEAPQVARVPTRAGGGAPSHQRSVFTRALEATVGALHHRVDDDGNVTFQRLPKWAMDRIADVQVATMVSMPAGVRIELLTDAPSIELDVRLTLLQLDDTPLAPAVFDIVTDGEDPVDSVETAAGTQVRINRRTGATEVVPAGPTTVRIAGLPGRPDSRVEIWLPHNAIVKLCDVRIPEGCDARPAPPRGPVWVHHGSSISHCMEAARPTDAWPVVVARRAGVSLLDLGFAGECQLDQFTARAIRDAAVDAVSLKLGVNVVNRDTMRERAFVPALHGFLDTVRDGHPTVPLVVTTPIHCPPSETTPGPTVVGEDGCARCVPRPAHLAEGALTVERVRALIAAVVATRRAAGDDALHLFDGLSLLGRDDAARLTDGTHPDAAGYRLVADRFHRLAFGPGGPFAHLCADV